MTKEQSKAPVMPAGFETVSDGSLANTHDFDKNPICTGVVRSLKVVPVRRGRVMEDNRLLTVEVEDGTVAVWESANLKDLFDMVEPGDSVYIEKIGTIDLQNGLNPMKQFQTGIQKADPRHGGQ